jgi:hypothetical protein
VDGHATLDELRNAPLGTLFRERRYAAGTITIDGAEHRMGREYRTAHALRTPRWFEQRIRQLEAGGSEPLTEG